MPLEVGEIRIRGHFCTLKPNLERRGCLVQALQDQAAQPGTEQKKSGSTDQVLNMANAPQLTPKVPHGANTPASTPPVNAEALRVTSKNAALMPDDSIQQSGENYHNNFQASLETGNTAAKTDPAAAARRQQYQTEIAAALEAGDYRHALKLFNEFGNPNLRALNEVQTQMSFAFFFQSKGMDKIKSYGESEEIINRTGKAEANGRFLNKSEKLYRYAPMIKPIDSFEDFTCHADPYTFYIDMVGEGKEKDFIELSPADYAEAIRNSKTYRGGNIRLISCQAGALENGAAQQVADALQVIVMAPTEIVNVDENGEMFLTDNEILAEIWYDADREERAKFKETGKWLTFYPRKE